MLVFFPCAWYHRTNVNSQSRTPDEATGEATTNSVDEITIEKVNGYADERKSQSNEGASMKGTCETEAGNVIIVHEENRSKSTAAVDGVINNKLGAENDANLAIQMLDFVLEAEDEGDSISSRRVSGQSITAKDADVSAITRSEAVYTEISPRNPLPVVGIDCEVAWKEIESEIDDILERARASVAEIETRKSTEIQSVHDENVFKNQTFLTHLNDLISKSNQRASPSVNVQSKTLDRRSDGRQTTATTLKHSKSAPDFNLILKMAEATSSSFKDDTSVHYALSDEEEEATTAPIPPPPVFSAELFEKVATLKRKDKTDDETVIEREKPRVEVVAAKEEFSVSLEGDPGDRENFRDKLEKLLRVPPTRLSLIAPVPLPRTSLARNDNREQEDAPREQYTPVSATMKRQRELFDEVLKKLQPREDS